MDWNKNAQEYLAVADQLFNELREPIDEVAAIIADRIARRGKVMICGNGGSAADAQHFAGELVNRFLMERRPYAGMALSTDTSVLTSIGNDYSYDEIFEKQVRALGLEGDVLIGISTSGNAANVCRAVEVAADLGILTIGLTGGSGGELISKVDHALSVTATSSTPRIQEGHQYIIHAICERIEEILQ
jgi:D-sedoheptulose 7-phosphate isomerase